MTYVKMLMLNLKGTLCSISDHVVASNTQHLFIVLQPNPNQFEYHFWLPLINISKQMLSLLSVKLQSSLRIWLCNMTIKTQLWTDPCDDQLFLPSSSYRDTVDSSIQSTNRNFSSKIVQKKLRNNDPLSDLCTVIFS